MSKYFRVDELETGAAGVMVALDPHRFGAVLRVRQGDALVLCDRAGALFDAVVRDGLVAEIIGPALAPERNPTLPLEVWLPLLKGGKSDDLVRQVTELGATRIVAFSSRNSVVHLDAKKAIERRERFAAIAREACNQCGRTDVPEVAIVDGLAQVGPGAFLGEVGGAAALETLATQSISRVLSGPEGGITTAEADALVALGWVPMSLGARILRAETAVVSLVTLAQAARGQI